MARKFTWTRAFSVPAQQVGEFIYGLADRSAEAIVEAASNPKCVLHPLFDWDVKAAARAHWLHQARVIVNSLEVEVVTKETKQQYVAAFIRSSSRGKYVPTLEASPQELTKEEERCIDEMRRFKSRWKRVQLARVVIDAITATEVSASRRKRKGRNEAI